MFKNVKLKKALNPARNSSDRQRCGNVHKNENVVI